MARKHNRHPPKATPVGSDTLPPSFPVEQKELDLWKYLNNHQNSLFSVRGYHRAFNVPRSTVYDLLERLEKKKLIIWEGNGSFKIIAKSETFLGVSENSARGVGTANLSTHKQKYIMRLKSRENFKPYLIKNLNPIDTKFLDLRNLPIHHLYFEDAVVTIKPKQIEIDVYEIINNDVEAACIMSLNIATKYVEKLFNIGLVGEDLKPPKGHYARIDSVLSGSLIKMFGKYEVDLGNGAKFWIDTSGGPPEDETDDPLTRERIDTFLRDVAKTDALLSDIDKIIQAVGGLTRLQILDRVDLVKQNMGEPIRDYDYFG